jgi:hypothetical protein
LLNIEDLPQEQQNILSRIIDDLRNKILSQNVINTIHDVINMLFMIDMLITVEERQ